MRGEAEVAMYMQYRNRSSTILDRHIKSDLMRRARRILGEALDLTEASEV